MTTEPTPTADDETGPDSVPSKEDSLLDAENPAAATEHLTPADRLRLWRESGGVSGPRRTPIEKLADNPASLRMAVTAKCYDCIGQDADPAWRWRIGNCGCPACPLFAVRPHQSLAGRPEPVAIGGAA